LNHLLSLLTGEHLLLLMLLSLLLGFRCPVQGRADGQLAQVPLCFEAPCECAQESYQQQQQHKSPRQGTREKQGTDGSASTSDQYFEHEWTQCGPDRPISIQRPATLFIHEVESLT
jgi:hypothetical protein